MGALTVTWKKFQMRDYYDSDKRQNGKPSTMKYAKMSTLTRSERNAFGIVNAFKRRRLENQFRYFERLFPQILHTVVSILVYASS